MSNILPSPGLQSLRFNVTKGTSPDQVTFTQEISSASWGQNSYLLTNPYIIKTLKTNPEGTDPFISAEYGNDGLGDILSTVNTRTLGGDDFCNCTSTLEDATATEAIAMVFNCMDFRLRENTTCNLNCKGYYNNYNEVIAAGVSLGYNGLKTFNGWSDYVDTHIVLGHKLHNIREILIVEHCQCGAYAEQYGDDTISEPTTTLDPITNLPVTKYPMSGSFLVQQHEFDLQTQNAQTCGTALWDKFNGTDGTLRPINNLLIIGYVAAIDGSHLTEIYRRNS